MNLSEHATRGVLHGITGDVWIHIFVMQVPSECYLGRLAQADLDNLNTTLFIIILVVLGGRKS